MRLKIENQNFFFNLVNKGHKVDIFNKEISSIDFFCSCTERETGKYCQLFPKGKNNCFLILFGAPSGLKGLILAAIEQILNKMGHN